MVALSILPAAAEEETPEKTSHRSQLATRSEEATAGTRPADGGPQSVDVSAMEQRMVDRINEIRAAHGLTPLKPNEDLNRIARGYSFRMNRFGYFGHYDHAGNDVAARMQAAEIRYSAVAENIAKNINFSDPVETAIEGWMKSEGHRANILTGSFRETGVGIWRDGTVYHLTQVFVEPR